MISAIASGAAALIVSHLWDRGTIVASAMTPVIVALVSEALRKPVESDLVYKPLRVARSAVTSNVPATFERTESGERRAEGASAPDVRIYSTGSNKVRTKPRRTLHLKVAIVTGLVAFVVAALALTLPELIFGGSVAGKGSTTYFGGSTQKSSSKGSSDQGGQKNTTTDSSGSKTDQTQQQTQTDQTTTQQQTTTTDQTAPSTTDTTPQGTTPATPPATPAPQPPPTTTPTPTTP